MSAVPRRVPTALFAAFGAVVTACGGGDGGDVTNPPPAATGSLTVTVAAASGLAAAVQVTGPGGFARSLTSSTTLSGLAPGAYTVAATDIADAGMRHVPSPRSVTAPVTAGGAATASVAFALPIASRSTSDRSDEAGGAQVKLLYALPVDGVDQGRDTSGVIQRSASSWQRWLSAQAGGRHFRLDTFDGGADVQFVRLPRSDATYRGYGVFIRDTIEKDLVAAGVAASATKLYLVYYEGGHVDRCASAAWPPALPGRVAAIYLHGTIAGGRNCDQNSFVTVPTAAPGYLEFVAAHELIHLLGGVSTSAADHGLGGHTIVDPADLMYAGPSAWQPSKFDVARRSYYNPAGLPSGVMNFASSPFVVTPP
ncbi:MAG: hypothetical protein IT355_08385 [Gemmatimonadaceae bacterium]|nr:hypothetical protein [Gemmatimonadaceae bacterium]